MRLVIYWILLGFCTLPGHVFANSLSSLERAWNLSPLHSKFKHRHEGLKLESLGASSKRLTINVWYEDRSVTKGEPASSEILCRVAHTMIYGKNRLRSEAGPLPLDRAFSSVKGLNQVRTRFFAVLYRNRPRSPDDEINRDKSSKDKLRVAWKREERLIPYLSATLSKKEWLKVKKALPAGKNLSFPHFEDQACSYILPLFPAMKSNFGALSEALFRKANYPESVTEQK